MRRIGLGLGVGVVLVLALTLTRQLPIQGDLNQTPNQNGYPLTVKDAYGKPFTVPAPPRRIISLSPNLTEILFALGLEEQIVGVTTWCNWPQEAKAKPKIGDMLTPNVEQIIHLNPDLIVGMQGFQRQYLQALSQRGLPVLVVDAPNLAAIPTLFTLLGQVTNRAQEGEVLAKELRRQLAAAEAKTGRYRPRVLMLVGLNPVYTVGQGSCQHELIHLAGGENIAAEAKHPWVQFSEEEIIASNPQVILLLDPAWRDLIAKPEWQGLAAIKENHVYVVDPDIYSRAGPRIGQALAELTQILAGVE